MRDHPPYLRDLRKKILSAADEGPSALPEGPFGKNLEAVELFRSADLWRTSVIKPLLELPRPPLHAGPGPSPLLPGGPQAGPSNFLLPEVIEWRRSKGRVAKRVEKTRPFSSERK